MMEFILIGIILIFVMTYRNSSGEGVYKFIKDQSTVIYEQYAPYSYKEIRKKIKELGLEYPLQGLEALPKEKAVEARKIILEGVREVRNK